MDDKENLSVHSSRKSFIPQLTRKTATRNGVARNASKEEGFAIELLRKTEESGKKKKNNSSDGVASLRPNTVSGGPRKKSEPREKERSPTGVHTRKSSSAQFKRISWDRRSTASADSAPPSPKGKDTKEGSTKNGEKAGSKGRGRSEGAEDSGLGSSLSRVVYEHGQMMGSLRAAREELRKKMAVKAKSKWGRGLKESGVGCESGCFFVEAGNPCNFESFYSGVLEEIFQAWVNLIYLIVNLKVGLVRVFDSAGTESFAPALRIEEEIIGKATECVKFFSRLKMKSLVGSLEEFHLPDGQRLTEKQIAEYEERISSPFLREMDLVQKKANEILKATKKEKEEVN